MHELGVYLRLRMMVCIWKGFRSMEPDLESFELSLENWIWKLKK